MNSIFPSLNLWAGHVLRFAWPMLWQSSLLIAVVWALDVALRRKARAAVRYTLWLLVLLKLVLPPSLAAPTAPGWWVRTNPNPSLPRYVTRIKTLDPQTVPVDFPASFYVPASPVFVIPPPKPEGLSKSAWAFLSSGAVSLALLAWVLVRWRFVTRQARRGAPGPDWLVDLLEQERRRTGLRRPVRLRLTDQAMSPAVCGLFRPVILLPKALVEEISPEGLRPVFLHELIHLRRGDVWVSWAQAILQILYWWHPLVWLANGCIRRAREEAVDDAVVVALKGEAECYAPTLLAVARLGLPRSLAALGLVGILESRTALRRRIERLVNLPAPRTAGLTLTSGLCILAFAAFAVPMGEGPAPADKGQPAPASAPSANSVNPAPVATPPDEVRKDWDRKIAEARAEVEPARQELKLGAAETGGNAARSLLTADGLRQLNAARIKTQAEFIRQQTLLSTLRSLDRDELIEVLPTAAPDNLLNDLLKKQTEADQRLSEAQEDYGPQHPEVVKAKSQAEDLKQRINQRVQGILGGLAAKVDSLGQGLTNLMLEAEKTRGGDPEKANQTYGEATRRLAEQVRQLPGGHSPAANAPAAKDRAAVLVQDGKLFYEMGKLDEAEAKLTEARKEDPENKAAQYYLDLCGQARLNQTLHQSIASSRTNGVSTDPLYFRTIMIEPNTFREGLSNAAAAVGLTWPTGQFPPLREYLAKSGVDLSPPKTLIYNDRQGTLLLHASLQDLDTIDRIVQVLNLTPPQVHLQTWFIELSEAEAKAFAAQHPSEGSSASPTFRLTPSQAREQLKRWTALAGAKLLEEAAVTTLTGRQVEITVADANEERDTNRTLPFGPTLDVTSSAFMDGFGVQIGMAATLVEFIGYDNPGQFVIQAVAGTNGLPITAQLPLPHFSHHEVSAAVNLWDGQTVVLGNLTAGNLGVTNVPGPMPTDVPLIGDLFRDDAGGTNRTHIVVVVTPTLIDPAGNRYHSESELPFAETSFPPDVKSVPFPVPRRPLDAPGRPLR